MPAQIEKLTIKGFKSIRSLEGFRLEPMNILIGANGAGKSNFVGFFALLREMVEQRLQLTIAETGGADASLYLGPKVTDAVTAKLRFGTNGYEFRLVPTVDSRLILALEVASYYGTDPPFHTHFGTGHAEAKLKDHRGDRGRMGGRRGVAFYVHGAISSWTVYHFHDTSATAPVRRKGTTRDYEALRPDAGNLAAFLLKLHDADQATYELIRDTVRLVAPFFDDFKLRAQPNGQDESVQLEWTQKGSDYPFHPSQVSDGTLRFICMATALLQPRPPATMLFDEPELGLHPYALAVLAGLLKQAATRTQVIVSTQSAPLLDYFDPEQVVVVDRKDGASVFRRLDPAALAQWLEQYSLGELWRKNVLEGGPANE